MTNDAPIGIFDSGLGGLTIWKEIKSLLHHENTIYIADSINNPYGTKSNLQIICLSDDITQKLISLGAKIIVVACNTATTTAIQTLRERYPIPIIGIEPAIKPALIHSKTKVIGVMATRGTLNSELFETTSSQYAQQHQIITQDATDLVPLIEKGDLNSPKIRALLETYLCPMMKQNMDYLVLGCTHYPLLKGVIRDIVPSSVQIIDSGIAIAQQTKRVLLHNGLCNKNEAAPSSYLYSNGDLDIFKKMIGQDFAQEDILVKGF